MRSIIISAAAVAVLAITTNTQAQCSFEHPKKAGKYQASLVQAFVSCGNLGGNTPDATTEGGIPSCKPPQTFNEHNGNFSTGWRWDELKGSGSVQLKSAKNKIGLSFLDPPDDTTDVAVSLKLNGVLDQLGPASGTGTLALIVRATLKDRMNGDMTVIDFPAGFGVPITDGKVSLKTTANSLLNNISQPGLPGCSSLELVDIRVNDENGNTFATVGLFNPPL